MFQLILAIHIVLSLFLIFVVLLQQGKGADAGVTFTGGSNTIFGVSGAGNVLTKATTAGACLFMLTSLLLVKYYPSGGVSTGGSVTDPLAGSVLGGQVKVEEKSVPSESTPTKSVETNAATVVVPNSAVVPESAPSKKSEENSKTQPLETNSQ